MSRQESIFTVTQWFAVACVVGVVATASGAEAPKANDPRALRRTPAVAVFQEWNESVVYVTGPILGGGQSEIEEFFRLPGKKLDQLSVGSGFIIHPAGYVLTNAHATEKVISHQVSLGDKTYPADLVATIHDQDVALLKFQPDRPIKAVRLARAGDVMIGESVIVIGNPQGLLRTCSVGVVSAEGRSSAIVDIKGLFLRDLLQTDAAINPGSSGGPWFNVLGEVIGMTTSKKRDADNIGFAVTAATLRRLLPGMLDAENRFGLVIGLALEGDEACRIKAVDPGSPAARAGLRPGDILTRIADWPTPTVADYHLALVDRKPEVPLAIALERDGKPLVGSLVPGRRVKPDAAGLLQKKLGLSAAPLDPKTAAAMILQVSRGVVITAVDPKFYATVTDKPAAGDVLARIADIRPRDMDQLALILEKLHSGQIVPMVLLRHRDNVATRIDIKFLVP